MVPKLDRLNAFIEDFKCACTKVLIRKLRLLCTTSFAKHKTCCSKSVIFITILYGKRDEKALCAVLTVHKGI